MMIATLVYACFTTKTRENRLLLGHVAVDVIATVFCYSISVVVVVVVDADVVASGRPS